ncbi:hypothetical protein lerEdw1_006139 [Lerista edwardsae]|nr:hypothetical protein lerEdw1_006139 [Lerista edwardsae]
MDITPSTRCSGEPREVTAPAQSPSCLLLELAGRSGEMGQRSGFLCLLFLILLSSFCSEVLVSSSMRSDTNLIDEREPVKRNADTVFTTLYLRHLAKQRLAAYLRDVFAEMERQESGIPWVELRQPEVSPCAVRHYHQQAEQPASGLPLACLNIQDHRVGMGIAPWYQMQWGAYTIRSPSSDTLAVRSNWLAAEEGRRPPLTAQSLPLGL